jgi:tetratricopeptide (TPR) repeat protein
VLLVAVALAIVGIPRWAAGHLHSESAAYLLIALRLNPMLFFRMDIEKVYYNGGNSRLEAGDKDGAIADYWQAAKLNPCLKQATEGVAILRIEIRRTKR